MKIGLTFDKREDYGIQSDCEIFADFCSESEVDYIAEAINACGYEVELIGNMFKLNEKILSGSFDCDLVFVADEGISSRNREIIVPALLELNKIPYVGSDAYAMGLSQNKFHTKLVAEFLGIKVPKQVYIPYSSLCRRDEIIDFVSSEMDKEQLCFPLVIKPNCEGYSMGVFKVWNIDELCDKVIWNMGHYKHEVLCEEYIAGDEVNAPILGNADSSYILGVNLSTHEDGSPIDIFTLKSKCFERIIDKAIEYDQETMDKIEDWSLKLYRHMGCRHFGRIDYKVTKNREVYFIEINPRPGLTPNGPFDTCAKTIGRTYASVIEEIISYALDKRM